MCTKSKKEEKEAGLTREGIVGGSHGLPSRFLSSMSSERRTRGRVGRGGEEGSKVVEERHLVEGRCKVRGGKGEEGRMKVEMGGRSCKGCNASREGMYRRESRCSRRVNRLEGRGEER